MRNCPLTLKILAIDKILRGRITVFTCVPFAGVMDKCSGFCMDIRNLNSGLYAYTLPIAISPVLDGNFST